MPDITGPPAKKRAVNIPPVSPNPIEEDIKPFIKLEPEDIKPIIIKREEDYVSPFIKQEKEYFKPSIEREQMPPPPSPALTPPVTPRKARAWYKGRASQYPFPSPRHARTPSQRSTSSASRRGRHASASSSRTTTSGTSCPPSPFSSRTISRASSLGQNLTPTSAGRRRNSMGIGSEQDGEGEDDGFEIVGTRRASVAANLFHNTLTDANDGLIFGGPSTRPSGPLKLTLELRLQGQVLDSSPPIALQNESERPRNVQAKLHQFLLALTRDARRGQ
ncbi:hypothetical protein FA10DRAFT_269033 [Acaromyces ingoldii]|uniref:Uncharacterized protein n=1 Tax=Acaromyces ingoldii TaxID=215250 RepID=A0A316YJ29_9BASI|nr:hypothetical protein FA10DRAFT_269033 [Acaromyces ingoldii]PWN87725.1 hypothetical protein FA10DRAFT_269033 [Acaromyces ingoldii]